MRIRSVLMMVLAMAVPAVAQTVESSPQVTSGDTLRVWASSARLDGAIAALARLNATELVLTGQTMNPNLPAREWSVPIAAVQRLEVLRGSPRSKARIATGVVLGAVVGGAIGGFLVPYVECGGACDKEGDLQPFEKPSLGIMIGAPIGALLGGVIGGTNRARWQPVTLTVR